jgi:hypothetical protein
LKNRSVYILQENRPIRFQFFRFGSWFLLKTPNLLYSDKLQRPAAPRAAAAAASTSSLRQSGLRLPARAGGRPLLLATRAALPPPVPRGVKGRRRRRLHLVPPAVRPLPPRARRPLLLAARAALPPPASRGAEGRRRRGPGHLQLHGVPRDAPASRSAAPASSSGRGRSSSPTAAPG